MAYGLTVCFFLNILLSQTLIRGSSNYNVDIDTYSLVGPARKNPIFSHLDTIVS